MKRVTKADRETLTLDALLRKYGPAAVRRAVDATPARLGQPPLDPVEVWGNDFQVWFAFEALRKGAGKRVLDARDEIARTLKISTKQVRDRCARVNLRMKADSGFAMVGHAILDWSLLYWGESARLMGVGTPHDDRGVIVNLVKRGKPKFPPRDG
jgi:hypothetical protein